MAITYDTVGTGYADDVSVSASLTVANNGDRVLIALIGIGRSTGAEQISTVKWNTTESFTFSGYVDNGVDQSAEIWYLINPTATSSSVVATAISGTPDLSITAISLYGAAQTDAVVGFVSSTGNSTTPSLNITTTTNNSWIIDILAVEDSSKTYTPGASQVERSDFTGGSGAGTFTNATSTKPTTTAGSNSTSWTIPTGAEYWVMASVEVLERPGSYSPSVSPSVSISPSKSPSVSPSLSPSKSPSISPSVSISPSKSPSTSPSISISPSKSPSTSPSVSISPSKSPSTSPSVSKSPSVSPSVSPSIVGSSVSPSTSPSFSPSVSPSPSPGSEVPDGETNWNNARTDGATWREVYH